MATQLAIDIYDVGDFINIYDMSTISNTKHFKDKNHTFKLLTINILS